MTDGEGGESELKQPEDAQQHIRKKEQQTVAQEVRKQQECFLVELHFSRLLDVSPKEGACQEGTTTRVRNGKKKRNKGTRFQVAPFPYDNKSTTRLTRA